MSDAVARAARPPELLVAAPFLTAAAICAVFAFVGLDASSYWIDELFSLFVIDHDGGLGEVLRRALTDTHPPAYYFIAYGWERLFGSSETALRSLSAMFAVAVLPVLFLGLRGVFSLPARSFAVATAAGSKLFFEQSQNARSYALCALLASILLVATLAIHRRAARGEPVPAPLAAGFWAVSLLASFTHFYAFLAVGGAHLFLLLTARTWRSRGAVVLGGGAVFALVAAYAVMLTHHSRQNLQNMWFSNRPWFLARELVDGLALSCGVLAFVGVLLLVLALALRRRLPARARARADGRRAAMMLSGLVILVTVLAGLAVSLAVAPSFGTRNLIVLGPFLWTVMAGLFDAAGPDLTLPSGRVLLLLLAGLTAANVLAVRTRPLPRLEEWRASADYVARMPGCAGQPIAVVLPDRFGPSTPFFRDLARSRFYGRYYPDRASLRVYTPAEFAPDAADPALRTLLQARAAASGCQVLAWGVHDLTTARAAQLQRAIAATAGVSASKVAIVSFARQKVGLFGTPASRPSAWVFVGVPG